MPAAVLPPTRVALVTGAAQGIGEAISLQLADDALDIALNDIPQKLNELKAVATTIEAKGRRALIVTGDVTVEDEMLVELAGTSDVVGASAPMASPRPSPRLAMVSPRF